MDANESYAALRSGRPANSLLVRALDRLGVHDGHALDLGAGPLNETRRLLAAGFQVDAVDWDPRSLAFAAALDHARLTLIPADLRDVRLEPRKYSIVVAIHVLPFLPRIDLPAVVLNLIECLAEGGILCCTLFGPNDDWAAHKPRMTFLSQAEVAALFSRLEPLLFEEEEFQGSDAHGEPKRWHVFRCLFRKRAGQASQN